MRSQRWRTLALVLAITGATTAFTILGGTKVERLEIAGAAVPASSATYDLLVLPPEAASGTEQAGGGSLLRPRQWQDIYGGITLRQVRQIQRTPGVEVAAPIAMVGYILQTVHVAVPIPQERLRAPAAYTATITHTTDQGLSKIVQPDVAVTYVTSDPDCLVRFPYPDLQPGADPFAVQTRRAGTCWSTRTGAASAWAQGVSQPSVADTWTFPTLVAAVDPAAEAALNDIDNAISTGRYLPEDTSADGSAAIPVIRAGSLADNDQDQVVVAQLPDRVAAAIEAGASATQIDRLLAESRETVVSTRTVTSAQAYQQLVTEALTSGRPDLVDAFWTSTSVDYVGHADGRVSVTPQPPPPPKTWQPHGTKLRMPPVDASDTAARQLVAHTALPGTALPLMSTVGIFDPGGMSAGRRGVTAFSAQSLPGADPATRRALGGRKLVPNTNPAGYPAGAPTMLMPLSRIDAFTDPAVFSNVNQAAPVSAVRVRVAGVTGTDALGRERVRTVADEIRRATGLQVSVTLGATPAQVTVTVPAGQHGRPQLSVTETWYRESAAAVNVQALELKSRILLLAVLLVCGLAVANATVASTGTLAPELRQQARLGLLPGEIRRHLMAEVGLLALAAGLLSALLVWLVAVASHVPVMPLHPLLAVPIAVAVGLIAAMVPVWRASEAAHSGQPARRPPPRRLHARGRLRAAIVHLLRTPGRSALCVAAVAIACGALTLQLLLTLVWHGSVVGDLFGVPVSLQDRWIDTAATALIVLAAAFVVGDVGLLAVRDRRAELADLRVQGLLRTQVAGLVVREIAILVLLGAALGGTAGATLAAVIDGALPG
ncbi:hypothetical protein [Phytohabitans flavus]|uniref:hypothetical protein n=1 Tax=Phytohabitans flavus TaxID=1076124 RepID=UPI0015675D01|nr:hypothetical protein [Phytohabitans flavus]